MALPAGAATATITVGAPIDIAGAAGTLVSLHVRPDVPAGLVWAADGTPIEPWSVSPTLGDSPVTSASLEVLADQPGVLTSITESGAPAMGEIRSWPLVATWVTRQSATGAPTRHVRRFNAPAPGVTLDLDLLPAHGATVPATVTYAQSITIGGAGIDTEGVQDVVGAMVAAAGGAYDDAAGTIALPSGGGSSAIDPTNAGFDLVLLLGQSNMSGRGTPYDARTDPADSRVFQYASSGAYANQIAEAFEPLGQVDTPSGIGPGLPFARWYASAIPGNRRVLLVPCAKGGTALCSDSTNAWRYGTASGLAADAVVQAQSALAAAGANARYAAILWHQGEQDASASVSGATYQADLDALIAGLRTDLGVADLPFIVGTIVPEYAVGTVDQIDAVHASTPARVDHTAVAVGLAGYTADNLHYNAAGVRLLGRAYFEAYLDALTHTATPDTSAPTWTATLTLGAPTSSSVVATASALATNDSGSVTYEVSYDNAATWATIVPSGSNFTLAGTASNTYATTKLRAKDAAGNCSTPFLSVPSYTMAASADVTNPTVGTMTANPITSSGFTLTVSGTSDAGGLHATPYAFTTDGGATWTPYQASPVYTASGLAAATGYSCNWRVRDAAGNVSTGTAQTVTTSGAWVDITDTFTRADSSTTMGTTETGAETWLYSNGVWGIASNRAYAVSRGVYAGEVVALVDSGVADCTITATLSVKSAFHGLIFRSNGVGASSDLDMFVLQYRASPEKYQLYKFNNGVPTQLGSDILSPAPANGDVLQAVLSGSSIIINVNGVQKISVTDSSFLTNTKHGIGVGSAVFEGGASAGRWDDFSITVP